MKSDENIKHNILLVITSLLFIIFVTGLARGSEVPVIPPIITIP